MDNIVRIKVDISQLARDLCFMRLITTRLCFNLSETRELFEGEGELDKLQ